MQLAGLTRDLDVVPVQVAPYPPSTSMAFATTSGFLPGEITVGTARAAFLHVFWELDWQLQFETLDPPTLDIISGYAFDNCLAGSDSEDYPTQARSCIAMRLQDLVVAVDARRLRHLGFSVDLLRSDLAVRDAALTRVRENISNTIRAEIDHQFDRRLSTWEDRMETMLAVAAQTERDAVMSHVGFDQRVGRKLLGKAIKYVFGTLELRISPRGSSAAVVGSHKVAGIRKDAVSTDEAARARSLVLRTADALAAQRQFTEDEASTALLDIRAEIEAAAAKDGCLGLIDIVKGASWASGEAQEPTVLCPIVSSLMDEQRERIVPSAGHN